jgi:release factor glutamine methyltransferase
MSPVPTGARPGRGELIETLTAAGCVAADDEVDELLSVATDDAALDRMLARRTTGEPLAWIVGSVRFAGASVRVDPGVYVPRWQSEQLALRGASLLTGGGLALDLCTGSGAVAVVLREARPHARVVGIDIDQRAARCARSNGVPVLTGDLDAALDPELAGRVDVITAVPPYVPTGSLELLPRDVRAFEPGIALDGGDDGLSMAKRVVGAARQWLRPGGWLLVEVGADHVAPMARHLGEQGFGGLEILLDGEGDRRGVCGRWERR